MSSDTRNQSAELAAYRARIYALIAYAFMDITNHDGFVIETSTGGGCEGGDDCAAVRVIHDPLVAILTDPNAQSQRRERHHEIFGHALRGRCPIFELEYGAGDILQIARELADITGFYRAFGLDLAATAQERADHIAIECEFMAFLAAREAYAIEHGHDQGLDIVRNAQCEFLRDHLGRWARAFAARVRDADGDALHGRVAELLDRFLVLDCERFGLTPGATVIGLRDIDPKRDAEIECGVDLADGGCGSQRFVPIQIGATS